VANNQRMTSRQSDAMFAVPRGEELGRFENYPDAQEMVNTLVSNGITAGALSIVGTDVTLVERVTGKIGYGRAALSSAISGSWLGAIAGLIVVVIDPNDFITPVLAGILIGSGAGMVIGMMIFTFSKGKRRLYRSMQQVIAQSYRVLVESAEHQKATQALARAEVPGAPIIGAESKKES
jgi:ABC-type multidrug transport system fused ATPase/permease subunit